MFIGNSYIIPAISNLPGQHPRGESGFAFKFKKDEASWFQASNNAAGNSQNPGVSCWIKIDDDFFVDFTPPGPGEPNPPTEIQHIIDKYDFTNGQPRGYRLTIEKSYNTQSTSTARRLVFQVGFGVGGQIRNFFDINSLSANTVYLVTASATVNSGVKPGPYIRLRLRGANNVSLVDENIISETVDTASAPLVIGNANPISNTAEFGGDIDEVAIYNNVAMTSTLTDEIFDWRNNKDLNNLTMPGNGALLYWWQMGENGSINSQGQWELPSQKQPATVILRSTGNVERISPGLPNQLYA